MPVDRVSTRGQNPGEVLQAHIEALEKKGDLQQVIPLFDEVLVIWTPKKRAAKETRTQ